MEFGRNAPMFLSDRLVSEGALEALLVVTIMWYDFSLHSEVNWRRISWKPRFEDKQWCFNSFGRRNWLGDW
jgi:hypothetical protein